MRLASVGVERSATHVRLVGRVELEDGGARELYYQFPSEVADFVFESADPFLPALIPACQMRGERLEILPAIDGQLLSRAQRVQEIIASWNPGFRRVPLLASARTEPSFERGGAVVSLFSGGVDSLYTLVKWRATPTPVSHVLFMKGLEQPLELTRDAEGAIALATEAARRQKAAAIAGETNLRSLFPRLNYEAVYQSAALASAALVLSRGVGRLLVPSSNAYSQLVPWGSHPLLDELWSTRRLEVMHDGAEARRIDKLTLLARDPAALAGLRVCVENRSGPFNCGRCKKCVRTMVGLEVLGVLPQARLFPARLGEDWQRRLEADHPEYAEELLDVARVRNDRPVLAAALEGVVRARRRMDALRALVENTPGLSEALDVARRARRLFGRSDPTASPLGRAAALHCD